MNVVNKPNEMDSNIARRLANLSSRLQEQRTGYAPKAVTVVLSDDTLVVTLHEALTPAERVLTRSLEGAAQVQEFHRQLFANSTDEMREEIKRITGRLVREAAVEIETGTGAVVHAFTTGTMVQVFLLTQGSLPNSGTDGAAIERADDEGLRMVCDTKVAK